jgi:phosphate starvation-inducible protein PhoH
MRGRNLFNSFVVADEMQNASYEQLKMLVMRIALGSKMVRGDYAQTKYS